MKALIDSEVPLPFISGFCKSGFHEGTRAKDYTGKPAKTCPFFVTCPCQCHKDLDRMFEMAGKERILQENPEYVPYERTFWMPSDDPDYGLPAPKADEPEPSDHLEVTETGRTRKGSLEAAVQRIVLRWMEQPVMERIEGLNVKEISERVYEEEGAALEKAPSLGAIGAVLDRWDKCGYVMLGAKPVRVISITPEGKEKGLEWCKARAKREGKAA